MTISCFTNLVGLRPGYGTTPTSNLYLSQLTGITIKAADAATNEEQQSGFALLQEKIDFAGEHVKADIRAFLQDKMKLDNLIESDTVGQYKDDMATVASEAGQYKGVQLRFEDYGHAELHINSISLYVQTSGDIDVKIFDLVTGTLLDTISVTAVANEIVEVLVNKVYKAKHRRLNLFIGYNATVASYATTTYYGSVCSSCGGNASFYRCRDLHMYLRAVKVPTAGAVQNTNLTAITNTAGLSVTYSLVCSAEGLMCNLANALAFAIQHKAGSLIMEELVFSKRLNSIVTLHGKDHRELADMYDARYESAMDKLLKNITLPKDICYRCDSRVNVRTRIP
jgi:hypothetical protein